MIFMVRGGRGRSLEMPLFYYSYFAEMEAYSTINSLLLRQNTTYQEFETHLIAFAVEQQTYLNLFLVTLVSHRGDCPDFERYLRLLIHFKDYTGKNSADINSIGYKDRKNALMHACQRGTPRVIQTLLQYNVEQQLRDPSGKSVAFYAVRNSNQEHCNAILGLLLTRFPRLLHMEAANGETLLNEAIHSLRVSTIELLLKRGVNVNSRLKDTGNTISHELLKRYYSNRERVMTILLLLTKFKANFDLQNAEGVTVLERAASEGIDFQNYASFCDLLEKESVAEENDYEFDKISLFTLNQRTKGFDTTSEMMDSQVYSAKVDFSEFDDQSILNQKEEEGEGEGEEEIEGEYKKDLEDVNYHEEDEDEEEEEEQVEILDFQALSQQIISLSAKDEQIYLAMIPKAEKIFQLIDKIANKHNLGIDIVGSFATGLWCPSSDIDISLNPKTNEYINFETTLQKIYKTLKQRRQELNIEDIYFLKGKVSCIKIAFGGEYKGQVFDISVFHRNHLNKQYASYIADSLRVFPVIKSLFFVYKRMCWEFELHDSQAGGIKNYALFLMISSVVKSMPTSNLGALFYHIAMYYGFSFEYGFEETRGKETQKGQEGEQKPEQVYLPEMRFNLIDPLNPRNNIGGKNTKAHKLRSMFRILYYYLMQGGHQPYLEHMFSLSSIL